MNGQEAGVPVAVVGAPFTTAAGRSSHMLWSAAVTVGGCTALTKLAAMGKDTLVAARFGSGEALDAFLLALVLPSFLVNVAAGTLPAALTPAYVAARESHGTTVAAALASRVLRSTYGMLAVLAVGAALLSLAYAWMPAASLGSETRRLLPWLALTMAPYTLMQGICAAWTGLLAAERGFAAGAIAPVAQTGGVVTALLLAPGMGVGALALGLLGGTLVQGAVLARALKRRGILVHGGAVPDAASAAVISASARGVRGQYVPAIAGAALMSGTTIIDQSMASFLPAGSVSALGFGVKVSALLMSVGSIALSTTLLPHLSTLISRGQWETVRALTRRVALLILAATIPVTALLIGFSVPIARVLYERGAFTPDQTALVASVQAAYLLQLPVHLLGILYVRLISALRMNRLLTVSAAVSLIVNLLANLLFIRWFGVTGIALSTACVYLVSCLFLAHGAYRTLAGAEARARSPEVPPRPSCTHTEAACASAA